MSKRDFRIPRADKHTWKPPDESRQAFVDRVHGKVTSGVTIQDLWLVYYRERFEARVSKPLEPEHIEMLKGVFYAGVSSMFYLMDKMAGESTEDDDIGAGRLQRIYEELETYTKGLK